MTRYGSDVTVLVPAFRPGKALLRTLASLQAQTRPARRVLLSLDHCPGHALAELPELEGLEVHPQSRRLGWVGNVNWLLGQVDTPLFMVLAHDDEVSPGFLEHTVAALDRRPGAIAAHGETLHLGIRDGEVASTPDITGAPTERALEFIRRGPHLAEMAWRGVVRSNCIRRGLHLRTRRSDGQFSNTLWVLELLLYGDSVAVPGVRYIKHTHPSDGLSRAFHARNHREKARMLADNLACLWDALRGKELKESDRLAITAAWADWLLSFRNTWAIIPEDPQQGWMTQSQRRAVATFLAEALASAGSRQECTS